MTEHMPEGKTLLQVGVGLIVATYVIAFVYVLVFSGEVDPRPIVRGLLAIIVGAIALSGRRWAAWLLVAFGFIWSAEQVMWGLRGAMDSFVFALLPISGSILIIKYLLSSKNSDGGN